MGRLSLVVVVVVVVVMVMAVTDSRAQEGSDCEDGKRKAGKCTNIRTCQPLRQILLALQSNTAGPGDLRFLRQSICSFASNGQPLVCCAAPAVNERPGGSLGRGGSRLLPSRCGVTGLTDRIIDGEDAPLLAWPWMALLRGRVQGQPSTWFCGGVLISSRYVLTAAHCFKRNLRTQLEFVRLGEHQLSTNPDCEHSLCAPTPQDIPVEQIISHPDYEKPCRECNDIALLRLSRPAQLNPLYVVPVCLPVDPVKDLGFPERDFQGKFAWSAGWGSTSRDPNRPSTPDKLQQVLLPINEGSFCSTLRAGYPDNRSTLCAGGEGKDTCRGDSGGPLLLSNINETRRFVVGITSLGPTVCGAQATQGLYTSVTYYVPWILQNLRE